MKTKLALIALLFSVATAPAYAINAHYRAQLERSGCTEISASDGSCDINKSKAENAAQPEKAAQIHDPMREASFSANGLNATISNGFFSATVNGKKATVKRLNAHFYEIHGAGYVISIVLDDNGITDASWNKTTGREHGVLQVTQQ
ncbi:hypothetical protein [Enterobacter cancerogenus]|jgi:hypothetical protein|uniref:Secreted protein n=1 Tax=Enterobacter cancerogenus TaxID=69218 RepID=A0AB38P6J5_9ENTR|nr:hypothetical protein [Enterobacter cancerogenus]AUJ80910.1 hypothetical protein CWI88_07570 [Enterobacter cancerogenus]KTQ47260.1 hypothetical protein NS104_12370 [Enterobacter cancerogenus]KTQ54710.1 hypothetical protein NS111_00675 [Enterobacter cancerogenus]KTQ75051.1 hypothetical protein NS188_04785 [Enterobacter cancerogenus]KTQ84124.1 hypothetical protein NS31R_04885 [Enterobacter cancerogenus]